MSDANTAASRLCAACGLCCNGVLFHTVRMQPGDSPKALSALGLKLKRKHGCQVLLQPCPAWRNSQCNIYDQRPVRCRAFKCKQLLRMEEGAATEIEAMQVIRDAKDRIARLDLLLAAAGAADGRKPLTRRFESATAEPLHDFSTPEQMTVRQELLKHMDELNALLDSAFRIANEKTEE